MGKHLAALKEPELGILITAEVEEAALLDERELRERVSELEAEVARLSRRVRELEGRNE